MPRYDYRCKECDFQFEVCHGFNDPIPDCPECSNQVQRIIKKAPMVAGGMLTHAGDGRTASKEELRDKWREETPKLRKKLRDKLGDDAVKNIPSLNTNYD